MERRPAGVMVAAVALGFVSLAMLVFAVLTAVSAAYMKNAPTPAAAAPGMVAPSTAMMMGAAMFMAGLWLAAGLWGIATTVGLLKMKGWARISVMILGGCLAALGLLMALGSAMVPAVMKSTPMPPNTNPAQLHIVLAAMVGMSVAVAGLGVWWLVYFALRGTRAAFEPATPVVVAARPVRVATPNPMTDFTYAQPIPPEERVEPKDVDGE